MLEQFFVDLSWPIVARLLLLLGPETNIIELLIATARRPWYSRAHDTVSIACDWRREPIALGGVPCRERALVGQIAGKIRRLAAQGA